MVHGSHLRLEYHGPSLPHPARPFNAFPAAGPTAGFPLPRPHFRVFSKHTLTFTGRRQLPPAPGATGEGRLTGDNGPDSGDLSMQLLRCWKWVVVGLLGLAVGAGCAGGSNEKRVIILINGNSPFWDAARVGLQDADKDFKLKEAGLHAVLEQNDGTPQGQLDKL